MRVVKVALAVYMAVVGSALIALSGYALLNGAHAGWMALFAGMGACSILSGVVAVSR